MSLDTLLDLPAPPVSLLQGASLFLDFDGTLVEIAERPDGVVVDDRLRALIRRATLRLPGRVAIVSGRSVAQVLDFLGAPDMAFAIAGSHGMELLHSGGGAPAPGPAPDLAPVAEAMAALADRVPGVLVERKPLGVVLHYRQAPGAEAESHALARRLADAHGLYVQHGKMMVEVRAAGGDKGTAIRTFMATPPYQGTRPVFLGDDTTDEPALAAAAALGGAGILVGPPRATAARYRLDGVGATLAWIDAALEALA